jgi:hypothetical protein
MILSSSRGATVCALLLSLTCSCATARRDSHLRDELDRHEFQKPLSEVWPAALRLLAREQYDLVGNDRAIAGQPADSNFFRRGFETREYSDKRRAMETMQNSAGVRYRLEGTDIEGRACRINFFALRREDRDYDKWRSRDVHMELALVRDLEPETADRIEATAK